VKNVWNDSVSGWGTFMNLVGPVANTVWAGGEQVLVFRSMAGVCDEVKMESKLDVMGGDC